MTTVFVPKIGPSKRARKTTEESNPWLIKQSKPSDFILTGMTSAGVIRTVPTTVRKICTTRLRATAPEPVHDESVSIPIHLYPAPDEKVAEHMRELCDLQKQTRKYTTKLRPLPNIVTFPQALEIYENNQVYYQDRLELKDQPEDEIITELHALEDWFAKIDTSDASEGYSSYCALPLRPYLTK